jgi:hypothetical protein
MSDDMEIRTKNAPRIDLSLNLRSKSFLRYFGIIYVVFRPLRP